MAFSSKTSLAVTKWRIVREMTAVEAHFENRRTTRIHLGICKYRRDIWHVNVFPTDVNALCSSTVKNSVNAEFPGKHKGFLK